jgi:hypothetical protein
MTSDELRMTNGGLRTAGGVFPLVIRHSSFVIQLGLLVAALFVCMLVVGAQDMQELLLQRSGEPIE